MVTGLRYSLGAASLFFMYYKVQDGGFLWPCHGRSWLCRALSAVSRGPRPLSPPLALLRGAGDSASQAQGETEVGEDLEASVDDPQHADAERVGLARDVEERQHELVLRGRGQPEALT